MNTNNEPTAIYTSLDPEKKFLFIFDYNMKTIANNFGFGCSLRLGVQVIAILFLITAFFDLICTFIEEKAIYIIISIIGVIIYTTVGVLLYCSVLNNNVNFAYISYLIFALIFIFKIVEALIIFILLLFGKAVKIGIFELDFYPYHRSYSLLAAFIYLFVEINLLVVQLYLIYILFSYLVHLQKGNINVINGTANRDIEN